MAIRENGGSWWSTYLLSMSQIHITIIISVHIGILCYVSWHTHAEHALYLGPTRASLPHRIMVSQLPHKTAAVGQDPKE